MLNNEKSKCGLKGASYISPIFKIIDIEILFVNEYFENSFSRFYTLASYI